MENNIQKKLYLQNYILIHKKIQRLNECICIYPESRDKYRQEIQELNIKSENIENTINNVDKSILSEVLFQKYVLNKTLEEIAYSLNYSKRQIERLHIKALSVLKIDK